MSISSKVKEVKSKMQGFAEKEKKDHRVINLMFVVAFSLIILLTLFGGVRVDLGTTVQGDGERVVVRQSFFQVLSAAVSGVIMDQESAEAYARSVDDLLRNRFDVAGLNLDQIRVGEGENPPLFVYPPIEQLDQFGRIVEEIRANGGNPARINWLRYRYAYAYAILNMTGQHGDVFRASWGGHISFILAGQSIITLLFTLVILITAVVMLIYAVIALIKKKPFTKAPLAILLMLIGVFGGMAFTFTLMRPNALWIIKTILIFALAGAYGFLRHMLMEDRDFSPSVFVHNCVLLLGGILSFIFLTGPLFRVITQEGRVVWYNLAYMFELQVGQTAYASLSPMSYVLVLVSLMITLGVPLILSTLLILSSVKKLINADYRHNEKRIMLFGLLITSVLMFVLYGAFGASGSLGVSSLFLDVRPLWIMFILQPILIGGLAAFEIMFKVKPIRKELVIN